MNIVAGLLSIFFCLMPLNALPKPNIPFTILQEEEGYFLDYEHKSKVVLKAKYPDKSLYARDIQIDIYKEDKIVLNIKPKTNNGYSPKLNIGKYDTTCLDRIFLGMDSGGSGGYGYFYLYETKDTKLKTLFDYEKFGRTHKYEGKYLNNYRVEVNNYKHSLEFIIDIGGKDKEYLNGIYDKNGELLKSQNADIGGVNFVFPSYNTTLGYNQLNVYQRVTGLYNADSLGYIVTFLSYKQGENTIMTYCAINSF